jgi:hypothetical protein
MRYSPRIEYRTSALIAFALIAIGVILSSSTTHAERDRNGRALRRTQVSGKAMHSVAPRTLNAAPVAGPFTVNTTNDTHAVLPLASALDSSGNISLRSATEAANAQGGTTTINVPPGTYNLSISPFELQVGSDPSENITINGTGTPSNTIIHQTVANNRVFDLDFNFTGDVAVSISNVTISGGQGDLYGGGGIVAGDPGDVLTVSNCVITGNSTTATNNGGGISFSGGGDLIIQNGTVISNNTATQGIGGGIFFDNGTNPGSLTITNSTISGNTATAGAGAGQGGGIFIGVFTGSTATIARSVFANNSAQTPIGQGGAIYVAGGIVAVNFSRIFGNTAASGSGIFETIGSGTVDANNNWWGCNGGPGSSAGCSAAVNGVQNVSVISWLQLRASASPNSICTGGTSTITADIFGLSSGGATPASNLTGLPAFPVPPATIFHNAVLGSLSGASTQFVDGMASATFTAGGTGGAGGADATADNQTQTASITVGQNTTSALANQTACEGGTASFTTTASGGGPFSFVWKKGATVLNNGDLGGRVTITSGGATSTLSISGLVVSDAGSYSVEATGACSTASSSATLTVNQNTSATTPADQTVCQGATANFSTTASGTNLHYAWTVDGSSFNGDSSSINVPTGSLSVGNHPVSVTVSGTCGSVTKNATLTVQASTATTDPPDQTVCQGAMANFSTTASGTGPFHYAWTLDGSPFNGDNASISVDTTSLSVGNHTVAVTTTGACGGASQSATLTVQAPTVTSDPADATVCQGATANFSTTASGTGPFSYAWTLDGSPFNGNSASINVPTGSLSVGNHTVAVTTTGACGSASQSATLTVQANTATSDPADATVCQGATANFSTTASGTGPFSYAWTLDGSPFNGNSASINVPTGSLSVGPHTVAVTTTGTCGTASQSATLTVQAPTATSDPPDQTVCKGATANFSTTASGTGPFHYAWTLDGSPFNGDSASISVPTGSLSSGPHTVAVTTSGSCGSASQSATLTVGSPPVITLSTNSATMWPPNHAYHTFNVSDFVANATGCDGNLTNSVVIASVSSDELQDNPGGADGSTLNDMVIAANCKSVQLRSERDANLNGRVYTITFRVRDSQGNTTTATAKVSVPVNNGGAAAVDDGPGAGYTVTSACP